MYAGRDRKHSQQSSSDESESDSDDESSEDDSEYRAARFDALPVEGGGIGCAATGGAAGSSCSHTELPFAS